MIEGSRHRRNTRCRSIFVEEAKIGFCCDVWWWSKMERGGCEVEFHDRSGSQTVEEAVGMHHCGRQCHHLHVFVDPTKLHDKSISCYCTSNTNNATNRSFGPLKSQLQFIEQSPLFDSGPLDRETEVSLQTTDQLVVRWRKNQATPTVLVMFCLFPIHTSTQNYNIASDQCLIYMPA